MQRVAGTAIEDAVDDDRRRTVLISDLHIGAPGPVLDRFEQVLEDAGRDGSDCRLVVLGDMFDAFVGPKQARVGVWRHVAQKLRAAAEAGVSITLLRGNRDFMLDRGFGRLAGSRVVAGGLLLRLDGEPCLLLHGDELCLNDLPYQRSKRWLRHPLVRFLARVLPLWVSVWVARKIRQKSQASVAKGDPTRFAPVATAVREAFATGATRLVFGHIHQPARGRFEDRGEYLGEYLVLPAFDEQFTFLEHRDRKLFYRDVAGKQVPDFPAREFPEPRRKSPPP